MAIMDIAIDSDAIPILVLCIDSVRLVSVMWNNRHMFTKRVGRLHSALGLYFVLLLLCGHTFGAERLWYAKDHLIWFHVLLGVVGVALPLSAASEFGHHNVKNVASGTLDPHATVSRDEMIEHSFYQALNVVQIVMLHISATDWFVHSSIVVRGSLCLLSTSPWLLRSRFPNHSFSANYTRIDASRSAIVAKLYRLKKYQYLLYKHVLLHGVSVMASLGSVRYINSPLFLTYWLVLNQSYVMEFFLQTLVKKRYMHQNEMLIHNSILMLVASYCAVRVLLIDVRVCVVGAISLILNLIWRANDFGNTAIVLLAISFLNAI
jgi:hypothetical protein